MSCFEEQVRDVKSSPLFDAKWYYAHYPDVRMLGMDAAEHYLKIGALMLRDPGPRFSTRQYLRNNRDVAAAGVNPLLHFLRRGRAEGRPYEPSAEVRTQASPHEITNLEGLEIADILRIRAAFDEDHYRAANPDVSAGDEGLFLHYMTVGWREGRDPSASFSTTYYLDHAPELRRAGVNPLVHYVLHGRRERRSALPYRKWLEQLSYSPRITAIVPNYNHARFLRQRIDSILAQTYHNVEIILLDDCSSDESRDVMAEYCERHPGKIRAIFNEHNSGNVFRQWRKGLEEAEGELVWICESDDFCEPDFLAAAVPHFKDRSVNICFGRIQFADKDGNFRPGLDNYREGAEAGIWDEAIVRPASQWFAGGFGVNNVIANVGGCVWRRQDLQPAVWEEAQTYSILGDWFLYCHVAGGGQIAYEPAAVSYFRQHGVNTSVSSFVRTPYYEEHQRLMTCLRRRWDVPSATIDNFVRKVANQYRHFQLEKEHGPFENYVDKARLKQVERVTPHVLIAFLGFHPGGGEVFPINLANALRARGWLVSMLAYDMLEVNEQMLASVDPSIPVYSAAQVRELGVPAFFENTGITIVHSHMVSIDAFLLEGDDLPENVRYIVSLHGSYEACRISSERLQRYVARVDHWVYTADKNLLPFRSIEVAEESFSKVPNGMELDPRPFPQSRKDLGIPEEAIVFALVARGVAGKGWAVATAAFTKLREAHPRRKIHLLLCGTGAEADRERQLHEGDPDITFLGYQSRIHGLYRLSDCAVVPTRFSGESFPLCIIQALQTGTPVIATDMGEIGRMIVPEGRAPGGLLVEYTKNTKRFVASVFDAMAKMLDDDSLREFGAGAKAIGKRYDIGQVAATYGALYGRLWRREAT